jgi:hypothetical protein
MALAGVPSLTFPAHLLAHSDRGAALWALEPSGLLRHYDLRLGHVSRRHAKLPTPSAWRALAAHPEGSFLILCDPDTTQLLELPLSGGDMLDLPYSGIAAAAVGVHPNGRALIALAHAAEGVVVLDAASLGFVWQAEYSGDPATIARPKVCFSPDGARLAVHHGAGVTLHDTLTGQALSRVALEGRTLLDFAPNPAWDTWALLAAGGDELLLATLEPAAPGGWVYSRAVVTAPACAVAAGPADAAWAATTRGGLLQVEPRLRDVVSAAPGARSPTARALEVSSDGRHLLSLWSDGCARVFSAAHLCAAP